MSDQRASERITEVVSAWPGVSAGPGPRGEFAYRLGRRELGHLHGDAVLHIGFPRATWHELHDAGRLNHHPVFPDTPGYGSRRLRTAADVDDAIAMLRINYDRLAARAAGSAPPLPAGRN